MPAFQAGTLAGEIEIAGRVLQLETVADLAGTVGFVSQDFEAQTFGTQVAQEVAFGLEQAAIPRGQIRERIATALRRVGLDQDARAIAVATALTDGF